MKGTLTKLNYVPEHTTDFIFCIVGEEQGFIGSMFMISFFLFLILRIIYVAENSSTRFVTNFGYGFAGILFFHVFINIGMTIGLVPVIGRSEEHTSELQSRGHLVCRLLLEK